jgi:transcriptional regulator with XRE-family HTH domain
MVVARERAKLTQAAVCAALEISQGTLSELETKGQGSSLVVQFAELYRCSPRWLALGAGPIEEALSAEVLGLALKVEMIDNPVQRIAALSKLDYVVRWLKEHPGATLVESTEQVTPEGEGEGTSPSAEPTRVLQLRA